MDKVKFRELVQAFIGIFIVVASVGYLVAISFDSIPHNDQNISAILPIFNTILATAVGFYLGGSLSSKSKDDTIGALTNTTPSPNSTIQKTEVTTTNTQPEPTKE